MKIASLIILFLAFSSSAIQAGIGDYDSSDFHALDWGLSFDGNISARGSVNLHRFSVHTDGLVALDVLASETKFTQGGDRIHARFEDGSWDLSTFDDHNNDGILSTLNSWIYLFRDDGNLTQDDNIPQLSRTGKSILMDNLGDNTFHLGYGYDRNGSNRSYHDPLGIFELEAGDYLLAIGAAQLSLRNAVDGSNSGAGSCAEYVFGECRAVGSYYIDIYGGDVADNTKIVANPIPAALPLFVSALGLMGIAGWRRRRSIETENDLP